MAQIEAVFFPQRTEAKMPAQKGSVEELFKELNALVGLGRVKSDVTQLANYLDWLGTTAGLVSGLVLRSVRALVRCA